MMSRARAKLAVAVLVGSAALTLVACEHGGGTGSAGVGTVAGAAGGAGLGRALFGNSTTGMLIGAAAGGLAGNMALDRPAEQRQQQEVEASRDAAMRRQLEYERQRALQADEVQRQIEERRLFEQWQRERNAQPSGA
jgi:Na+/glutamate symporter